MKKLILLTLLVFGYSSIGQTVKFGTKSGVNFSNINSDDTGDLETQTSFHLGLVTEIPLGANFALQPEFFYSSQGAKYEETGTLEGGEYSSYRYKLKLDYLNLPLLAKYSITPGLSLQAGPQIGYLIKAEVERVLTIGRDTDANKNDVKDHFKNIDFALSGGLQYELEMGVFFNARYNAGIYNIEDAENDDDYMYNNVFQLSVGYMF